MNFLKRRYTVLAYTDFDLKKAIEDFSLIEERKANLFAAVEAVEPSPSLQLWLDDFASMAIANNTEKARSEFIIAPFLGEMRRRSKLPLSILSGIALDVDRSRGLFGFCNFLIARSTASFYLKSPVLAVVEAKREDVIGGLGQCVAEMVAIRLFNEQEQSPVPVVFGCVTSGNVWRFLKLEGSTVSIDDFDYGLREADQLLGVLIHIAAG